MDRVAFLEKLKTENSEIDYGWIRNIVKKSINTSI